MAGKLFFTWRYWFENPPWDTGITPPEVYDFLASHPAGRGLDLGCGTGTNVITLAKHSWQASGVDFVPSAVKKARRKARRAGVEGQTQFIVGDVLAPATFQGEYDLILDIGCFHSLPEGAAVIYGQNLRAHLRQGGSFLLYAHLKSGPGPGHGASEASLSKLGEYLALVSRADGQESWRPSAWLHFRNG